MPIEISDLEEMLERVKKREAAAEAELRDAETSQERAQIRERLEALEARNAELEAQLKGAREAEEEEPEPEPVEEPEPDQNVVRRTRPGRRSGQAYTYTIDENGDRVEVDIPTIYSGPDEPDEVELPDAADAA